MKKVFAFISVIVLSIFMFLPVSVQAATAHGGQYYFYLRTGIKTTDNDHPDGYMSKYEWKYVCSDTPFTVDFISNNLKFYNGNKFGYSCQRDYYTYGTLIPPNDYEWNVLFENKTNVGTIYFNPNSLVYPDECCIITNVSVSNLDNITKYTHDEYYEAMEPVPPEPEPGEDWLSDMWDWFMYVMGWGDDPSIIQITGGDKVETEIVTPSPTPSLTPIPSPTPYSLDIIDPSTGQPVYSITGIPNNTYNIYGGDTINNGSDFDIFDVDLKIGNGGTTKPKDDLNEVMRTNNDYIQEMDISAVKNSFSVLPADWFLLLGVLASLPIIAGIISKMLK